MSVLIKGMEMPLCCQQCPLCADEGRFCMAARRCIPMVGRVDWCPLVEVATPHGRLIDADELAPIWDINEDGAAYEYYLPGMIYYAPTIIEAEE